MKKIIAFVVLALASVSFNAMANTTYYKCSSSVGGKEYTGLAATFSMSQGEGGHTVDGMDFYGTSVGSVGDVEKDKQGDSLVITNSVITSQNPFTWTEKLKVVKASGKVAFYTCQNLPEEPEVVVVQQAPVHYSHSGNCQHYDDIASDGSLCGLRSSDSRRRPY